MRKVAPRGRLVFTHANMAPWWRSVFTHAHNPLSKVGHLCMRTTPPQPGRVTAHVPDIP